MFRQREDKDCPVASDAITHKNGHSLGVVRARPSPGLLKSKPLALSVAITTHSCVTDEFLNCGIFTCSVRGRRRTGRRVCHKAPGAAGKLKRTRQAPANHSAERKVYFPHSEPPHGASVSATRIAAVALDSTADQGSQRDAARLRGCARPDVASLRIPVGAPSSWRSGCAVMRGGSPSGKHAAMMPVTSRKSGSKLLPLIRTSFQRFQP